MSSGSAHMSFHHSPRYACREGAYKSDGVYKTENAHREHKETEHADKDGAPQVSFAGCNGATGGKPPLKKSVCGYGKGKIAKGSDRRHRLRKHKPESHYKETFTDLNVTQQHTQGVHGKPTAEEFSFPRPYKGFYHQVPFGSGKGSKAHTTPFQAHKNMCLDPACNRPFQCPSHLQRHWEKVHDGGKGGKFKCKKCSNTIGFTTQRYLTMHTAQTHAETEFENQLLLCPEHPCNETFSKRLDLQQHLKNLHQKETGTLFWLCKPCFKKGNCLIFETEESMLAHLEQCDFHMSAAENHSGGLQPSTSTLPCGYYPSSDAPVQQNVLMPAGPLETYGDHMLYWTSLAVPFAAHRLSTEICTNEIPSSQSSLNGLTASAASSIYSIAQPLKCTVSNDWNFSAPQSFFPGPHHNMGGYDSIELLTGPPVSSNMFIQSYYNLCSPQASAASNIDSSVWPGMGDCSFFAPQYLPQSHRTHMTLED